MADDNQKINQENKNMRDQILNLQTELEKVQKEKREITYQSDQQISALKHKIESLENHTKSLEELNKSLKDENASASGKDIISNLESKLAESENKVFLCEQREMNLKRQIHTLNIEVSDLKIEIEKINFSRPSDDTNNSTKDTYLENMDDETQKLLSGLMAEIEELKREKNELSEKALNLVTEKELENMELKEKLDQVQEAHHNEINELLIRFNDLQSNKSDNKVLDDDRQSINSMEGEELIQKCKKYEEELRDIKFMNERKDQFYEMEIEKLKRENEYIDSKLKGNITQLENELSNMKLEINKLEMEKFELQRELNTDSDSKASYYNTLEDYQNKVHRLEEMKEKMEKNFRAQITDLNKDVEEYDTQNKELKSKNEELLQSVEKLNNELQKKDIGLEDKYKQELSVKESEIKALLEKQLIILRELDQMKSENDLFKKNSSKHKSDLLELRESMKKLSESNSVELKRWEEKYYNLEKKIEIERNNLIESNSKLMKQLTLHQTSPKIQLPKTSVASIENQNLLSEALGEDDDENDIQDLQMKIGSLETELSNYSNKITELNKTINRLTSEKEVMEKKDLKNKEDINALKAMYEEQIKTLTKQNNKISAERTSLKKSSLVGVDTDGLSSKHLQMYNDLNKVCSSLKAEVKYLTEQNEILKKDFKNHQILREKDIEYYKAELKFCEGIAVNSKIQMASYVYEKDEEIFKLKTMNRRLQEKLQKLVPHSKK